MAMELDNLIKRIKKDGVEEARKKADTIVEDAENSARKIMLDAEEKRAAIIEKGKKDAATLMQNGEKALKQASRDLMLSLRQKIMDLFDSLVKREISNALSSEDLKGIIVKAIESFKKDQGSNIEILLNKQDKDALEKSLLKGLKEDLKKDVNIKVSTSIKQGFRIGQKGKNFYYDFTDESIAEAFKIFLNPKIREILK